MEEMKVLVGEEVNLVWKLVICWGVAHGIQRFGCVMRMPQMLASGHCSIIRLYKKNQ